MKKIQVGLFGFTESEYDSLSKEFLSEQVWCSFTHFTSDERFRQSLERKELNLVLLKHHSGKIDAKSVTQFITEQELLLPIVILADNILESEVATFIFDFGVGDIIKHNDIDRLKTSLSKEYSFISVNQDDIHSRLFNHLSLASEHAINAVIITDEQGCIQWVNESFTQMTEYTLDEVLGKKPGDFLQGKNTNRMTVQEISNNLRKLIKFNAEIINYTKSGEEYWIKLNISPIFEDGKHIGFIGIQENDSARKSAERYLIKKEELFRTLTDNLPGVVIRYSMGKDNPGTIEFISEQCLNVYGVSQEDILLDNAKLWNLIDPSDLEQMLPTIEESAKTMNQWKFQYKITNPSGEEKWIRASGTPRKSLAENSEIIWDTLAIDITKEMQYEKALLETNKRLVDAQKMGNIGDWYYDFLTDTITYSEEMYHIYGLDPSLPVPSYDELVFGFTVENTEELDKTIQRGILSGESYSVNYRIKTKQGIFKDLVSIGLPEKNHHGEIIALHGICQDITSRKEVIRRMEESENALKLSNERLDAAIDGANLGVWDLSLPSGENVVNDRWFEMLGYGIGEIQPNFSSFVDLLHPDDKHLPEKGFEILKNGKDTFDLTLRLRHKNGSYRFIRDIGRITERDSNGEPTRLIGTHHDVTEQYLLEQKLKDSLKEKTILLQEIHHRVKNNLAIIIGLLHLQAYKSSNLRVTELYEVFSNRIKSIADVHELLYNSDNLSNINLNLYMKKLFSNIIGLSTTEKDTKCFIYVDEDFELNINQAVPLGLLLNELLTNTIKYAFHETEDPKIAFSAVKTDNKIKISYKDNGVGVDVEEIKEPKSLGFTLINTLLDQLEANYKFTNGQGFGIDFEIPDQKYKGAHSYLDQPNGSKR